MHFALIDCILSRTPDSLVAIKHVSLAEEYLQDHFPGFPILPGVLMLEAMVQAGRELVRAHPQADGRVVLGQVRALKYGTFVKPGRTIRIEVSLLKVVGGKPGEPSAPGEPGEAGEAASFEFKGEVLLLPQVLVGQVSGAGGAVAAPVAAASGRFTLRPVRTSVIR